jgi:uncharacterized protein (DUF1778 family)
MATKGTHGSRQRASKQDRLAVRIDREQKELLQRAADLAGRTLSDLVLEGTRRYAEDVIREHTTIKLSVRDTQAFMDALLNPPTPSPRLRAAAERYKREVRER